VRVERHRLLAGAYYDSLVLMRLQGALTALPGVDEAAAMMATPANREILAASGLWPAGAGAARADDLLVVLRAADEPAAEAALGRVEALLRERGQAVAGEYRYRGLEAALRDRQDARWVAISVPGAHAAAVAETALDAGRHVFLFSDNVTLEDEVRLKERARQRGLLMLGPDCGTAIIGGLGLGFSNRLAPGADPPGKWLAPDRAEAPKKWLAPEGTPAGKGKTAYTTTAAADTGNRLAPLGVSSGGGNLRDYERGRGRWLAPSRGVGLVGASGTGLQAVSCRVEGLGGRVSQAIGVGGRDLWRQVGARSTLAALELLERDPGTAVVVVVSKPPAAQVASRVLRRALAMTKPVVVCFVGGEAAPPVGGVHLVAGLDAAAERAVELAAAVETVDVGDGAAAASTATAGGYVRGLFSGGTLALEVAAALRVWLSPLASNLGLAGTVPLDDPRPGFGAAAVGHVVVDLGADELTVGRPHPMIDPAPRDERLRREAADPAVGLILVDVVLGDGAAADPACGLAPAIEAALAGAAEAGRELAVVALVVGTPRDPQGLDEQVSRLGAAGARVVRSVSAAVAEALGYAARHVSATESLAEQAAGPPPATVPPATVQPATVPPATVPPVPLDALDRPAVINVGLEAFAAAVRDQGSDAVQVDWRPPAGGDERLAAILARMRAASRGAGGAGTAEVGGPRQGAGA